MKHMMNLVIVFVLLFLAACTAQPAVHRVTPDEAAALIAEKESRNLFVVNVHTPYEGEIAGTDSFIDDWENVAAQKDKLPVDKSQPILVYCRTGRMSESAVFQLQTLGYTNIYHLEGGMRAWNNAGLPLMNYTGG